VGDVQENPGGGGKVATKSTKDFVLFVAILMLR
jgi:hypothetical protein